MSRRRKHRPTPPRSQPTAPIRHALPTDEEAEKGARELAIYPKRLPGRPTLLTPDVEGRFLGMLMKGVYRNAAAEACGLKPNTVEKWMRRGRGRDKDFKPTPEYVMFVRRVEQAEATARAEVESNIVRRSKYDHNAGALWLRTRYPDEWPRYPGGVEEEGPDNPFRAPTPPPMDTPREVRQQTNILFLDSKEWPELASRLIGQQRAAQNERDAETAVVEEQEEASVGVPRHDRLNALRADDSAD